MTTQLSFDFKVVDIVYPVAIMPTNLSVEEKRYLFGPIVHHPGGWSREISAMYREAVGSQRIELISGTGRTQNPLAATEVECLLYLYGAVMCAPPSDDYFRIYMYLTKRFVEKVQKRSWPLEESQDSLTDWHIALLRNMAGDIRRAVVKNFKSSAVEC